MEVRDACEGIDGIIDTWHHHLAILLWRSANDSRCRNALSRPYFQQG